MKVPAIDEPIRLGGVFWIVYFIIMAPSLWLFHPWTWDGPIYSIIAGIILPPFLVSIVLYSVVLFTVSLIANFRSQKTALLIFGAALVTPIVFLFAAWHFSGYRNLPSIFAFIASSIGYSILFMTQRNRSIKSPQPTAGSSAAHRG